MLVRRRIPWFAALFAVTSVGAWAAPFSCLLQSAGTPSIRAGGFYEETGNLLLVCRGGTPPVGAAPLVQLKLTFPEGIPVTSRVLDSAVQATEALAFVNEPFPSRQVLCETPATPAQCAPSANAFPGILTGPRELTWTLPMGAPGDAGALQVRLTNLRVQAPVPQEGSETAVTPVLTVTGAGAPVLSNSAVTAAGSMRLLAMNSGPSSFAGSCSETGNPPRLTVIEYRLRELASISSFRRRNDASPVSGSKVPPAPVAQSELGVIYQTETGFYNPAFPGVYGTAGLASFGTRLYLRFINVPAGVRFSTPAEVPLHAVGPGGVLTVSGFARRVVTDSSGGGAFSATAGGDVDMVDQGGGVVEAVYELVETDATAFERLDVPAKISYSGGAVPLDGVRVDFGFAPREDSSAFQRFKATGQQGGGFFIPSCAPGEPVVPPPPTSAGLAFVPVKPCRLVDTREDRADGLGKPALAGGVAREFRLPSAAGCGLPATARAYSLNFTVVPKGPLGYLSVWPAGATQPFVSTLNSVDGRIKANAAIVPAGNGGGISTFSTDATELVVDVNGYFVPASANPQALAFYPLTPCRIADTRNPNGGPVIASGVPRVFPVLASNCGVPANAQAYSLNATAVPGGSPLGYLTLWPTGQEQPFVSTLNSPKGETVANAAIVPAGTNGSVTAFAQGQTHLVLDINGYFAPPGAANAQRFFTVQPCRVADSRLGSFVGSFYVEGGLLPGTVTVSPLVTNCGLPSTAAAYAFNATAPVPSALGYLTLWPSGQAQPFVSTLNAITDRIVSNAAIVPAGSFGNVDMYITNPAHLVLDVNGFFAP